MNCVAENLLAVRLEDSEEVSKYTFAAARNLLPLSRSNWAFTVSQTLDEDDQLMVRLQDGDSSAFDEIVD